MANDFSADSTCIALYNFESGSLLADSKGSETLTQPGTGITAYGALFMQGSWSGRFIPASNGYAYRTDANLVSTFPLKSGTSNTTISVPVWVRWDALPASGTTWNIMGKTLYAGNKATIGITIKNDAGTSTVRMDLGKTDGTYSESVIHASAISVDTWYHMTFAYRDSDKFVAIRLRDTSGNVIGSDLTTTATANIALFSDSDFMVGAVGNNGSPGGPFHSGLMDELVVFSKILTATDSTNIAKGLYSGTGDSGGPLVSANDTATITEDVKMHMPISLKMMKLP